MFSPAMQKVLKRLRRYRFKKAAGAIRHPSRKDSEGNPSCPLNVLCDGKVPNYMGSVMAPMLGLSFAEQEEFFRAADLGVRYDHKLRKAIAQACRVSV